MRVSEGWRERSAPSRRPIVLDSSVLVAYERMKTPDTQLMHEAQSRIGQWLLREVTLLVPALSLAVACARMRR